MRSTWGGAIWQPWLIFYLPHWDCVCVSLSACVSALHNWPPPPHCPHKGRSRSVGLWLLQASIPPSQAAARKSARQRERGLQKHQKSGLTINFFPMVVLASSALIWSYLEAEAIIMDILDMNFRP